MSFIAMFKLRMFVKLRMSTNSNGEFICIGDGDDDDEIKSFAYRGVFFCCCYCCCFSFRYAVCCFGF